MSEDYGRCWCFFFSSRRRHTRCALVTGVQTCALPILSASLARRPWWDRFRGEAAVVGFTLALGVVAFLVLYPIVLLFLNSFEEIGRASCRERVCQYV